MKLRSRRRRAQSVLRRRTTERHSHPRLPTRAGTLAAVRRGAPSVAGWPELRRVHRLVFPKPRLLSQGPSDDEAHEGEGAEARAAATLLAAPGGLLFLSISAASLSASRQQALSSSLPPPTLRASPLCILLGCRRRQAIWANALAALCSPRPAAHLSLFRPPVAREPLRSHRRCRLGSPRSSLGCRRQAKPSHSGECSCRRALLPRPLNRRLLCTLSLSTQDGALSTQDGALSTQDGAARRRTAAPGGFSDVRA